MTTRKPISLLDAAFFELESAERMANIGPLIVLKPPPGKLPRQFADWLMARMMNQPAGPPFDQIYVPPSPLRMPRLETVARVDLNRHCHRLTLAPPGNEKALFDLVCKLHVQRLPRSRPLWAFYVIDGLESGRIAIYGKVHHGLIDGLSFIELLTKGMSEDPATQTLRAPWQGLPVRLQAQESAPAAAVNLTALAQQALDAGQAALGFTHFVFRQTLKTLGLGQGTPLPFLGTGNAFAAAPDVKRSFAYCRLPLSGIKGFGRQHGATVNDVLLTVVDMALNRYLSERRPGKRREALVADMPIALHGGIAGGNQITALQIRLGAPSDNPGQRLCEVMQHVGEAKRQVREESSAALMIYAAMVHSIPALAERFGITSMPMLANMVISNPFGFAGKAYIAGAKVELALPVSVLMPGQSLNVTATSYDGHLQIAFLGMAAQLPDIEKLADYTVKAFSGLRSYMLSNRPASTSSAKPKPKPKPKAQSGSALASPTS